MQKSNSNGWVVAEDLKETDAKKNTRKHCSRMRTARLETICAFSFSGHNWMLLGGVGIGPQVLCRGGGYP